MIENEEYYMRLALRQAKKAAEEKEIPVGAVLVFENTIIAQAHNQVQLLTDVTAHAEILALTAGSQKLGTKFLSQCTLYVTLEPCIMCAGASFWFQLGRLIWGAADKNRGYQKVNPSVLHPKTQVKTNILSTECENEITSFFKTLRK